MKEIRIFIDMDGVLAKWQKDTPFEEVQKKGYFKSLSANINMIIATKLMIKNGMNVNILSTVLPDNHSAYDKSCWLDEHLPEIPVEKRFFVPYNKDKNVYIQEQTDPEIFSIDVLLDDFSENLHKWAKSDKIGIKILNGINNSNGTWKGKKISLFDSPEFIVKEIKEVCNAA